MNNNKTKLLVLKTTTQFQYNIVRDCLEKDPDIKFGKCPSNYNSGGNYFYYGVEEDGEKAASCCCYGSSFYVDYLKDEEKTLYSFGGLEDFINAIKDLCKKETIKLGDYEVEMVDGKIKIGCQTFTQEEMKELIGAAKVFIKRFDTVSIGGDLFNESHVEKLENWLNKVK